MLSFPWNVKGVKVSRSISPEPSDIESAMLADNISKLEEPYLFVNLILIFSPEAEIWTISRIELLVNCIGGRFLVWVENWELDHVVQYVDSSLKFANKIFLIEIMKNKENKNVNNNLIISSFFYLLNFYIKS